MSEKLCIFCRHFHWRKEEMWGMGSTLTGPMMEGGDAACGMGHYSNHPDGGGSFPDDEADFRRIILRGQNCKDYERPRSGPEGRANGPSGAVGDVDYNKGTP